MNNMERSPAIAMEHVTKTFRLLQSGGRTLKAAAMDWVRFGRARRMFHALDDVCFDVAAGETLGIIGANGSGKSTLLSVAARTMAPSAGRVTTRGTISSLLELGAGFHPDLTGRENVFLYGAIMGLSQADMRQRFEAIVDFAGIADYIDQPVRHYSSGMYVRLGFAVAVEVDPDILLIDEVLAVGDADFQGKCMKKMHEFKRRGKTMLMVSHDLSTIQAVSDRIMLLDNGRVVGMGAAERVVNQYRVLAAQQGTGDLAREWGSGEIKIAAVEFHDGTGRPATTFRWGAPLAADIRWRAQQRIENPVFGFSVCDREGRLIHGSNTQIDGVRLDALQGEGRLRLRLAPVCLATGAFLFSFSVHSSDHKTNYHRLDHAFPIVVEAEKAAAGPCYMPSRWTLEP